MYSRETVKDRGTGGDLQSLMDASADDIDLTGSMMNDRSSTARACPSLGTRRTVPQPKGDGDDGDHKEQPRKGEIHRERRGMGCHQEFLAVLRLP